MSWLRHLYDWVLSWADSPYGLLALFVLAFAESVFFPVPPDVLLIAMALGRRSRALWFGLVCSAGSLLGGMTGYALGHFVWLSGEEFTALARFFFDVVPGFSESVYYELGERFEAWGFIIVFTAGFTPVPYKLFTVSAGAFAINFPLFVLASAISRTARFLLVSGLIWKFGFTVKRFIDRYFNILAVAFAVALAAGFAVLKLL
ncbi:MAG: DedA family protein [Bacteroidota bacterium]|nr:DedA family protein [Bacteroidota bacterium]MDE2956690.1 DedA family protein [Bacteroidota bacterium]